MNDDETLRAQNELDRFNAGDRACFDVTSEPSTAATMATVASLMPQGTEAIRAWLLGVGERERRERIAHLRQYAALSPPGHQELVASALSGHWEHLIRTEQNNPPTPDEK